MASRRPVSNSRNRAAVELEVVVAAVDDRQRAGQPVLRVLAADPDRDQRARADLAGQRGLGQDRDARGNLDGPLDVLDVVELEHDLDVHIVMAQEAIDRPADRQLGVEGDERLAVQLANLDRALDAKRCDGWTARIITSSRQGMTVSSGHLRGYEIRPSSASPPVTRSTTRVGCRYSSRTLASGYRSSKVLTYWLMWCRPTE